MSISLRDAIVNWNSRIQTENCDIIRISVLIGAIGFMFDTFFHDMP
jgi:hypothetical protein